MLRLARGWMLGAMLLGVAGLAGPAAAQTLGTDELSALTFRPAPGTHRYLMIDGVDIGRRSDLPFELVTDYAYRPLYVSTFCEEVGVECDDEDLDRVAVVQHLLAFHLGAALPIGRRLELGLSLPIVYAKGNGWAFDDPGGRPRAISGGSATGIGDPLLSVRARLFGGAEEGLGLATVVYGTLPIGQLTMEGRHTGDDLPNAGGHLVGEAFHDQVRGALTLGAVYRTPRELTSERVGPMLTYGAAVEWGVSDAAAVLGELQGGLGLGEATPQLELRGAGRLLLGSVELTGGAGVGLVRGPGVPWVRLFAGIRWAPLPAEDHDRDGVPDASDECSDAAEDRDGFADEDGCPDLDDDGDQVADEDDRCPTAAEDRDGHQDEDGCPDLDDDGDGVPDGYDSCLEEQEDRDGDRDEDGCPEVDDRDSDGVPDTTDRCPDEAEDTDGLADEDGCPETDADNDGVPDLEDDCADTYGTDCHEEPATPPTGTNTDAGADVGAGADQLPGAGSPPPPTSPTDPAAPPQPQPQPQPPDAGTPRPPDAGRPPPPPPPSDDGIDWSPP